MKNKSMSIILAVFLSLCFIGSSPAMDQGNKRKGKYTYRKVYKACQQRGEVDSAMPPISPADKTQAEWKQIFETKTLDGFGCKAEWAGLNKTQLSDIYSYLFNYAADSPSPAKCK